ncbi:hypothetical protein VOLCADRAFT_87163 [Volvox carteri f. nagariensis]|uniref:Uncharacterized protein n=1 Tax=Volvox carteri f. nagariensis TaxID=3068 RepID=D8TKC3_VOLCA|nr:uncharacterized protein VOLCADRAFT_87163 [Volvox carteri f. nagariensis]EFJ52035.1 hypothetical protein VOLCADRAFT_87163 [Volvox carteri f. nagariensis]|eukprot:XP_002946809.1 hypothetical protein VOLCADRAFT_87163 [Volvox carteri f. nagariensis]
MSIALTPQAPAATNGENESIVQLLEHFKDDDGRVALLVKELQELSNRVQVAELATVDPRLATAGRRGSGTDSGAGAGNSGGPPYRRGSSPTSASGARLRGADAFADAVHRVRRTIYHGPPKSQQGQGSGGGGSGGSGENGRGQAESGSGSGRVEEAVLPEPPEDPSQPLPLPPGGHEWEALQAAVNDSVASFGAAAAKMGWKKWALTRAHSALLVSLFWWVVAAAFRSEHPLSRPLQDFAFGHFCRHYVTVVLNLRGKARDQYQQVWIEMMAAAALYLLVDVFPRAAAVASGGGGGGGPPRVMALTRSPPALASAASEMFSGHSGKSTPHRRPSSTRISPEGSIKNSTSSRTFMGSVTAPAGLAGYGNDGSVNGGGGGGGDGDGRGHGGPQAFVFTKNSPVMVQMLLAGAGGGGGGGGGSSAAAEAYGGGGGSGAAAPPIIKGLMKHTVGGTLARFHRALDEASDEELSYSRLAAAASASTTDAVSSYEASRRAAAAEAAAMRRGLLEVRGLIEARQRAALAAGSGQLKQMSDRLSGYIQNDVDRLMAGKPTGAEPASSGDVPRYLRPIAGHRSGGAVGESPSIKPARLMAPLYEMRRVEGNIRAALAGGRHSSTDTVARVTAVTAAREAASAADWRPLAQYPVGTKDTRRRKMAAHVLYGLDLEQYTL